MLLSDQLILINLFPNPTLTNLDLLGLDRSQNQKHRKAAGLEALLCIHPTLLSMKESFLWRKTYSRVGFDSSLTLLSQLYSRAVEFCTTESSYCTVLAAPLASHWFLSSYSSAFLEMLAERIDSEHADADGFISSGQVRRATPTYWMDKWSNIPPMPVAFSPAVLDLIYIYFNGHHVYCYQSHGFRRLWVMHGV